MDFDRWLVAVWEKQDKEREFVLEFWASSLPIGEKGSLRTSEPLSEVKLREELTKMNVSKEETEAHITKARNTY
jgi:hypothetical protein